MPDFAIPLRTLVQGQNGGLAKGGSRSWDRQGQEGLLLLGVADAPARLALQLGFELETEDIGGVADVRELFGLVDLVEQVDEVERCVLLLVGGEVRMALAQQRLEHAGPDALLVEVVLLAFGLALALKQNRLVLLWDRVVSAGQAIGDLDNLTMEAIGREAAAVGHVLEGAQVVPLDELGQREQELKHHCDVAAIGD